MGAPAVKYDRYQKGSIKMLKVSLTLCNKFTNDEVDSFEVEKSYVNYKFGLE